MVEKTEATRTAKFKALFLNTGRRIEGSLNHSHDKTPEIRKVPIIENDLAVRERIWKAFNGDTPMPAPQKGAILKYAGSLNKYVRAGDSFSEVLDQLYD